ncbi:MAG TPA: c-type cytochrome [Stellaceae bacterium]|jgi:cytochrome c|nr:c-type cytochrome [Stellaceae bacterium]
MSFEANKIAGAILAAMILAMVSGIIANILVHPTPLAKQAYEVAGGPPEGAAGATAAAAPAGPEPIAPLMEKASADAGKSKSQLCAACHSFDKGGPNRIGPNLYGVIGAPIAEDRGGFAFSSALQEKGKGKTWTLDELNAWLFKPQDFAKGTKMTFIGLPKAEDRANVVAYLNSMSDKPLPVADLTKGAATGAPAGGEQKQGAAPAGGEQKQGAAPAQGGQQGAAPAQGGQQQRAVNPQSGAAPQAATPGPGNQSSNAPTTNGPAQNNNAAPRTPANEAGTNPSSSATEGQAK